MFKPKIWYCYKYHWGTRKIKVDTKEFQAKICNLEFENVEEKIWNQN
jgi:hypothetical protein